MPVLEIDAGVAWCALCQVPIHPISIFLARSANLPEGLYIFHFFGRQFIIRLIASILFSMHISCTQLMSLVIPLYNISEAVQVA